MKAYRLLLYHPTTLLLQQQTTTTTTTTWMASNWLQTDRGLLYRNLRPAPFSKLLWTVRNSMQCCKQLRQSAAALSVQLRMSNMLRLLLYVRVVGNSKLQTLFLIAGWLHVSTDSRKHIDGATLYITTAAGRGIVRHSCSLCGLCSVADYILAQLADLGPNLQAMGDLVAGA